MPTECAISLTPMAARGHDDALEAGDRVSVLTRVWGEQWARASHDGDWQIGRTHGVVLSVEVHGLASCRTRSNARTRYVCNFHERDGDYVAWNRTALYLESRRSEQARAVDSGSGPVPLAPGDRVSVLTRVWGDEWAQAKHLTEWRDGRTYGVVAHSHGQSRWVCDFGEGLSARVPWQRRAIRFEGRAEELTWRDHGHPFIGKRGRRFFPGHPPSDGTLVTWLPAVMRRDGTVAEVALWHVS